MSKKIEHNWVLGENLISDVGLELLPLCSVFGRKDVSITALFHIVSSVLHFHSILGHQTCTRSFLPPLSSLLVIRPASLNLLPLWVGFTSGSYFYRGTILLFTPRTGRY